MSFELAEDFEWSNALLVEDTRENDNERRYQALGFIDETRAYAGAYAE